MFTSGCDYRRILGVRMAIEGLDFIAFLTFHENRCDKTTWFSLIPFVGCTLVAQVVLTIRSEISVDCQLWVGDS